MAHLGPNGLAAVDDAKELDTSSSVRPPCTATLLFLLAWLLAYSVIQGFRQRRQRADSPPPPPGPAGLPLIGSLLELCRDPIQRLRGFALEYGPIFTVKLGLVEVFFLNEVDIIHEAYVSKGSACNDRPALLGSLTGAGGDQGMVTLRLGRFHRYQRHFALEIMRNTGIGTQSGEKFFTLCTENVCRHLALSQQRPIDSKRALEKYVFQALAFFLFGGDSKSIDKLIALRDSPADLLHFNPVLVLASKVLPNAFIDRLMPNKRATMDAFLEVMDQQRQLYRADPRPPSAASSYMEGLLAIQRDSERQVRKAGHPEAGENAPDGLMARALAALAPDAHYAMVFLDFFTVGTETTLVGLLWTVQMLMLHPHWQTRIQAELDEVVGEGEMPSLRHKPMLHSTMAVITEVFRFRPTAALGAPHCVTRDTLLGGYLIPKGSLLLSNIFAANHDPKRWSRPDEFDPSRFLDDRGQFHVPQRMMTFSTGGRSCPGEKWARSLIFLLTTAIFQRFTLTFPEGEPLPDPNGHPGINHSPHPFKMCAVPR